MKNRRPIFYIALAVVLAFALSSCDGSCGFDSTDLQNDLLIDLKGKYGDLSDKLAALQEKHDALQSEYGDSKTELTGKYDALQSEHRALQGECAVLLSELAALQKKLADSKVNEADLLKEVERLMAQINALNAAMDALTAAMSGMWSPASLLTYGIGDWGGQSWSYAASNKVRTGVPYVELGEYPCTYVGGEMNYTLNLEYQYGAVISSIIPTGRGFTSNDGTDTAYSAFYAPKSSPEYWYNGQKYVRVDILPHNPDNPFSTGAAIGSSGVRWIKVEPIKWLIGNWDKLPKNINPDGDGTAKTMDLIAAETLMAGIPFSANSLLWENSILRMFLNSVFLGEAFDAGERALIASSVLPNNALDDSYQVVEAGAPTVDKVFLPSYHDVADPNGMFSGVFDSATKRQALLNH